MKDCDLALHTDYFSSTFGATTATGLSAMVDGAVSQDRVTRLLSSQDFTSRDLWRKVQSATLGTQSNHVLLSICATFKLESLSIKQKLNPFALCRKLLINATRSAYDQLQILGSAA